jgi:hypothetical protein
MTFDHFNEVDENIVETDKDAFEGLFDHFLITDVVLMGGSNRFKMVQELHKMEPELPLDGVRLRAVNRGGVGLRDFDRAVLFVIQIDETRPEFLYCFSVRGRFVIPCGYKQSGVLSAIPVMVRFKGPNCNANSHSGNDWPYILDYVECCRDSGGGLDEHGGLPPSATLRRA